jgi:hypothetical protein
MKKYVAMIALTLAFAGCGGADFAGAPDVRGMNLVDADKMLQDAGYTSTIVQTEAMFGVIVESNFAVCDQDSTRGHIVPLRVAKHGC